MGIGFFNAITKPQHAIILDSNNNKYKLETSPWTNYNIVVLDQTMKNNSSITLVNTNVLRSGKDYDANVTAFLFDLYDKKVDWNVWGKMANSRLFSNGKNVSGYNYEINLGKFRGPFNFEIHQYGVDAKYEQNDLGYFTNNNYYNNGFAAWYKFNKPKRLYNRMFFQMNGTYSQQYKPRRFQYVSISAHGDAQLKNLWTVGFNTNLTPLQQDFYEPRYEGKYFKKPSYWQFGIFVNTNTAKKYSLSFETNKLRSSKYDNDGYDLYLGHQYRFNNKFSVGFNTYADFTENNLGFAFIQKSNIGNAIDSVYFGLRKRNTVINTLTLKYSFNTKMGIYLRARHYWSRVDYNHFFYLKDDGYLQHADPVVTGNNDPDNNANFFNIDMTYTWEFAQGSFINIAWKDASQLFDQNIHDKYSKNFSNVVGNPQQTNFSIKVIYYLDYLALKKKKA